MIKTYDFPTRISSPERARRELHRLEASYGRANEHRDTAACRYLAARLGRLAPYLRHRTTQQIRPED